MTLATGLAWLAWWFVIFNIAPDQAGIIGFGFFYASLFLSIVGTFSVLSFLLRRLIKGKIETREHQAHHPFRQGIGFASLAVIFLILLSKHLLLWWNALALVVLFIIIEIIFFTGSKRRASEELGIKN